jgi:hypothetical protein
MMLASVVITSGDFWRASSCTSPNTLTPATSPSQGPGMVVRHV